MVNKVLNSQRVSFFSDLHLFSVSSVKTKLRHLVGEVTFHFRSELKRVPGNKTLPRELIHRIIAYDIGQQAIGEPLSEPCTRGFNPRLVAHVVN